MLSLSTGLQALIRCLSQGNCRRRMSHFARHHLLLTIATGGWVATSFLYVDYVMEYGQIIRAIRDEEYHLVCPVTSVVATPLETPSIPKLPTPTPKPPDPPKILPRPIPDSNLRQYARDRLSNLDDLTHKP